MNEVQLLAAVVAVPLVGALYAWFFDMRNPRVREGMREVGDAEDNGRTLLGGVWIVFWLLAAVPLAVAGLLGQVRGNLWFGALMFAALGVWRVGIEPLKQLRERKVAMPGSLQVSAWPLAPGHEIDVQLVRPLHTDAPVGVATKASSLVLEHYIQQGRYAEWHPIVTYTVPEPLSCEVRERLLEARWRITLPTDGMPARRGGWFNLPRAARHFRWVLRIALPVEGCPDLDSCFYLAFAFPEPS